MLMRGSYLFNQVTFLCDELQSSLVGTVHQFSDLLIDELCRGLAVRLLQHHVTLPWQIERHLAHLFTHPKLHDLQHMNNVRSAEKAEIESKAKEQLADQGPTPRGCLYLSVG